MTSLQTTSNSMRSLAFRVAAAGSTPLYSSRKRVATSATGSSCASCFQIPVELIRSRRSTRVLESVLLCWMKISIMCTMLCTCRKMIRTIAWLMSRGDAHQRRVEDVTQAVLALSALYAVFSHRLARIRLKVTRQQCTSAARYHNVLSDSGSDASSLRLSRRREPPHQL